MSIFLPVYECVCVVCVGMHAQVSREILEERKGKELRKIESAITLELNFERQVICFSIT